MKSTFGVRKYTFLIMLLIAMNSIAKGQTIRYVKLGGSGTTSGADWANASGDLQAMINASDSGDQVWVGWGMYIPNRRADNLNVINNTQDRNNSFVMKSGVNIYGSFSGTEKSLEKRTSTNLASELSGDFLKNDLVAGSDSNLTMYLNNENAYHVVMIVGGSVTLDRFNITGGNA